MIILDWDKIGYRTMTIWIYEILRSKHFKSIEICASPTLDGYHIYIEEFSFISPTWRYRFRFEHHDDKGRLLKDMFNKKSPVREVSFNYKMKNGIKFNEIKILKYYRRNTRELWQVKFPNLDSLIKNYSQELLQV